MLPIVLRPDGRRALIVGGGSVALRKAEALHAAGFPLVVVAPAIDPSLKALLQRSGGEAHERPYESQDIRGAAVAIAATDDDAVNARVVADARAAGALVNDAIDGERGDFTMPAVARLGAVTIAVHSSGTAPAFSKRIAHEIAQTFGKEYERAAKTLAHVRTYVKATLPRGERHVVLDALSALPVGELASMNAVQAEHVVEATVARLRGNETAATATVTCASRGSALAMTQTRTVAARLAEHGIATTILTVTTAGDRDRNKPIERLGTNVFVKELEIALRERRADYAVHSCKDLPSDLPPDMHLAAFSARADARDAFCSERYEGFFALPAGAVVGTSSPRRRSALAALRSDLDYRDVRGNVDTRLRKLRDGEFDAIVIAMAGLERLDLRAKRTVAFSVEEMVPAVGQGVLAIETRAGDAALAMALREAVNDPEAELCVTCERSALRALRAGCSTPIGIHARIENGVMVVDGFFGVDGSARRVQLRERIADRPAAASLGERLAAQLKRSPGESPLCGRFIVLPRTQERASRIAEALRELGADVLELREGDAGPDPAQRIPDMLLFPSSGSVAVARPYLDRLRDFARPIVAAMGPESARAAREAGFEPNDVAPDAKTTALVTLALERLGVG